MTAERVTFIFGHGRSRDTGTHEPKADGHRDGDGAGSAVRVIDRWSPARVAPSGIWLPTTDLNLVR